MKEEFPFTDADGIVDVTGNYLLEDAQTGEEVVILDNDYSVMQDAWKIRDPGTEAKIAEINSRGGAVMLAPESPHTGHYYSAQVRDYRRGWRPYRQH